MEDLSVGEAWRKVVLESVGDGIVTIDSDGKILSFNPAAERMFGFSAGEVLGKKVNLLMPSPDREQHDGYVRRYLETGEARIIGREREVEALRKDGRRFPAGIMVTEIGTDGPRLFIGIVRDITERKRYEAELLRYRTHLEELVAERTRQLEASFQQLRAAERLASVGELAAKIAHEIKNPIAGIYAAVQLLAREVPPGDPKGEVFENVMQEIRRLDETMQDLLRFARPVPPSRTAVELGHFLKDLAESLKRNPTVAKHRIRIEAPEGLVLDLDPLLMGQVFGNLILNACQAMDRTGSVRVTAKAKDGKARIEVADTGPGIPPDILPSIFDPFFTTKSKGTGLGLSIARKNVEAHAGTITVQSAVGKGTTFLIVLPTGTELA